YKLIIDPNGNKSNLKLSHFYDKKGQKERFLSMHSAEFLPGGQAEEFKSHPVKFRRSAFPWGKVAKPKFLTDEGQTLSN
ncbi:MAG: hypothetical protein IJE28_06100, partial [Oscillospiraceae bacterium]|nr:hypothetical protein [Oscillospiraceae bacterium]